MEQGWSIKQMHRLIMSSRSYQLSSVDHPDNAAVDPDNRFLWRANRQRLDAEQIRDSILDIGDQLDLTIGDRQPFPHRLTYFYRQHEPFQEDYPTLRRSVYMMQPRIRKNLFLDLFDGPDGNIQFAERKATTTSLQGLYLMNSQFMHNQASLIADNLIAGTERLTDRVDWCYQRIFGRRPRTGELQRAELYVGHATGMLAVRGFHDDTVHQRVWAGYIRGMISSNEFMFVD